MFARAHWGAVGEFAASRHGVITRQQAAALGVSPNVIARLIRIGQVTEPASGVLIVVGAPTTWKQSLLVAITACNAVAVASHRSAAALHQLDGYASGPIEVVVPSARKQLHQVAVVRQGRLTPGDVVRVEGFRCTGIARTLIDLAAIDPPLKVAAAFESAWRNGASLKWIAQIAERERLKGRRESLLIGSLVEGAREHQRPTESALELRLAKVLTGVDGVVRQFEVKDENGSFVARADFAVPDSKLAIEAHSRRFHFGPEAVACDEEREHRLKAAGWDVLYFGQRSLGRPNEIRETVRRVSRHRLGDQRLASS